jgi:hypothetical protein
MKGEAGEGEAPQNVRHTSPDAPLARGLSEAVRKAAFR